MYIHIDVLPQAWVKARHPSPAVEGFVECAFFPNLPARSRYASKPGLSTRSCQTSLQNGREGRGEFRDSRTKFGLPGQVVRPSRGAATRVSGLGEVAMDCCPNSPARGRRARTCTVLSANGGQYPTAQTRQAANTHLGVREDRVKIVIGHGDSTRG